MFGKLSHQNGSRARFKLDRKKVIVMTTIEKGEFLDTSEQEMKLNTEKSLAKSMFTLYRSRLLLATEEADKPGAELYSTCRKMDSHMELAMNIMSKLSYLYMTGKKLDNFISILEFMQTR